MDKTKEAFAEPPAYSTPVYSTYSMEPLPPKPCVITPSHMGCRSRCGNRDPNAPVDWSKKVLCMSLCSVLCCGFFGIIATAMSIMAYVDSKVSEP